MKATSSARRSVPKPPRRDRLKVSVSKSNQLRKFASLLDVRPEDFLDWILSDYVESLDDPGAGLLMEWADGMLVHDTPEQAVEVKTRVHAWLERKAARRETAELKGGRKP